MGRADRKKKSNQMANRENGSSKCQKNRGCEGSLPCGTSRGHDGLKLSNSTLKILISLPLA